jgi:riboflavin biosynthesis pyrimidine reductase
MVASANGVVAWRRAGPAGDPVAAILGGETRPDRIADRRLMRYLRSIGDAAVGAETVRAQPDLVLTPQEPGDEPAEELYALRAARGLPRHPRNVVYSRFGRLPPGHLMFSTPGLGAIAVTTEAGAVELRRRRLEGALAVVAELELDAAGLRRAHRRLLAEHGVRHLACEGGQTIIDALHAAGLLDELFLTRTDVVIDEGAHPGVIHALEPEAQGARLLARGRVGDGGYTFERWLFSAPPDADGPPG